MKKLLQKNLPANRPAFSISNIHDETITNVSTLKNKTLEIFHNIAKGNFIPNLEYNKQASYKLYNRSEQEILAREYYAKTITSFDSNLKRIYLVGVTYKYIGSVVTKTVLM